MPFKVARSGTYPIEYQQTEPTSRRPVRLYQHQRRLDKPHFWASSRVFFVKPYYCGFLNRLGRIRRFPASKQVAIKAMTVTVENLGCDILYEIFELVCKASSQ